MITIKIDHRDNWEACVDMDSAKQIINTLVLAKEGEKARRDEVKKNHKQEAPDIKLPGGEV